MVKGIQESTKPMASTHTPQQVISMVSHHFAPMRRITCPIISHRNQEKKTCRLYQITGNLTQGVCDEEQEKSNRVSAA